MIEISEFKDLVMQIIRDGCQIAIAFAIAERCINAMISFVTGEKRVRL